MKSVILVCACLAALASAQVGVEPRGKPHLERALNRQSILEPKVGAVGAVQSKEATAGQFKYYVGALVDMNYFCGGTLINPRWVLTAAHCVSRSTLFTLFLGATDMQVPKEEGREVHVTRSSFLHPEFDGDIFINDVGLIQLLADVVPNSRIGMVKLSNSMTLPSVNPTVVGFGATGDEEFEPQLTNKKLMYTEVPIASTTDLCYSLYGLAEPSQICLDTSGVEHPACIGDDGGPIIVTDSATSEDTQIGFTSFGPTFGPTLGCSHGYPVVGTNIAYFIPWIERTTGIHYPFDKNTQ